MEQNKNITNDREMVLSRLLDAPRDLVFEVWTNPDHIKNWWGPNGFTNTIFKMDARTGGEWDFIMHGPDGTDYKNRNIFKEVTKPSKIVYDHVTAPLHQTTVTFEEQGNKTLLTMRMRFQTAQEKENMIRVFKADVGMVQNADRLEAYLKNTFPG